MRLGGEVFRVTLSLWKRERGEGRERERCKSRTVWYNHRSVYFTDTTKVLGMTTSITQ